MSTKLTKNNIPMVESQSLKLVFASAGVQEQLVSYLSQSLLNKGYDSITPAMLNFLSSMDCGINYASDIARSLDVSRQMVAKMVKELCKIGYLEQKSGSGKQKEIIFTVLGEKLISDARQLLADLDHLVCREIGQESFQSTIEKLEDIKKVIVQIDKK